MKFRTFATRAVVTVLATAGLPGVQGRTGRNLSTSQPRTFAAGVPSVNSPQPVSFVARLDFPVQKPMALALGDFNGDGKMDVAVASSSLDSVSVLFGIGDGSLQEPMSYAVGSNPIAIAVGDFNGDGKPDIVTANGTSNSVSVLLNQGNGTFQLAPQTNLVIGQFPNSLVVGDFNRDGKLDVAVVVALAQVGASAVEVFLGKGDGTFQPGVNYPVGGGASSVAVGDFNADGIMDLATTDTGVSLLLGRGDGTFLPATHSTAGNAPHSVVVGDFNNDGKLDVAVANSELESFSILLGKGDGTFQSPIQSDQAGTHPADAVAADVNGDGKLDLVLDLGPSAVVLLGNGDGTFQSGSRISTGTLGIPGDMAVADLNGDGKPDLVGLGLYPNDNFVSVLLGIGDGSFQTAETVGLQPAPFQTVQTVATDLNGDGNVDLVASLANGGNGGNQVEVLLGNGIGAFGNPQTTPLPFGADATSGLAVGDFNKDGKPDIVVGNRQGSVSILLGNGDGSFRPPVDYGAGASPLQVAVGDFNGDGNPDVIVANSQGTMSLLLGRGDGTFGFATTITLGSAGTLLSSFAVGDFNNDGKLDLAIAALLNPASNVMTVSLLLGKGDGTFQAPINIPLPSTGINSSAMAIGDFNRDGNLDLVVANATFVLELLGDGHGNFAVTQLLSDPVLSPFSSVAAADLNGDGNVDIAVGDRISQHILLLLGSGNGLFALPSYFGTNLGLGSIAIADLNGDGRLDLVGTSGLGLVGTSGIDLLFNRASGPATPGAMISPANLSFGGQIVGSTSSVQTITLGNNGTLPLAIKTISIAGTNSGDFSQTNDCGTNMSVGSSCHINATFDPTTSGGRSALISISDNASSSPQAIPLLGSGQDIQMSASPTSVAVTAGNAGTSQLSISPLSGFSQSLSLSCSGAPIAATCSVSPTSVSFSGGGPAAATVTVTTTTRSAAFPRLGRPRFWRRDYFQVGFALLLLALVISTALWRMAATRPRPLWKKMLTTMGLVVLSLMAMSCGGGGHSGTQPGTYTLTITAEAGGFARTTKLSLTVN